jgi:hypothetical protein
MSTQNLTNLTVQEAQKILKPFNCLEGKTINSKSEQDLIRQALLLLTQHSDYQIFGVCADTTNQGLAALKNYAEALGYQSNFDITPIDGSVYIKHNPNTKLCYLDSYTGIHRGVLVSYQSSDDEGVNEIYGHLPLDLFV